MTVKCERSELVAVALLAAVISVWAGSAGGSFSFLALVACEAAFFAFYLVGSLFASWKSLASGVLFDLPLRLLVGYAVVNTALLALAWLSPLHAVANFGVVFALVLAAFFSRRAREVGRGDTVTLLTVAICVLATGLWCQDSICPLSQRGDVVELEPWVDGFYHSVHIRSFGASHGAASIEDFRMASVPARPYHYGMYPLPAFIKQAAGLHSYAAFAGILAPVGVLFTGFAAYAFVGSLWGAWPGLAAVVALLLLPDGAQQGMQNPFMSYHWLTQISPSATYGLSLLAVAWLFVIQGCVRASRLQVVTGWVFAGVLVAYKLHYVVASALLLMLVPALFFGEQARRRKRALWAACACGVYWIALWIGQEVPGVPLIRFDGSDAGEILRLVLSFAKPGVFRDFLNAHLAPKFPTATNLLLGVPYVTLAVLGVFAPLLFGLAFRLWKRVPLLYVLFPLLLLANFLVMFFGLALDFASSTPDELSHRPLLIVYFFGVSWVGGALGLLLVEHQGPRGVARKVIAGAAALLMVVPAWLGPGVQRMWAMPLISPVKLPVALLRVAEYIRAHGEASDVFQHSQFDRTYAIAAWSERRTFVAHTLTRMPYRGDMVEARTNAVEHLMAIRQAKLVVGTARALGIRWFVLERGDRVDWPAELADHPVLEAGPFRLYRF